MNRFPFFRQQTIYWCGPGCAQMLLAMAGIRISQRQLARMSGTTARDGMSVPLFKAVLRSFGVPFRTKVQAGFSDITRALNADRGVVVAFVEPCDEEPHYSVVVKLTKRSIILNDPWNGRGFPIARDDFFRRWRPMNRWMLVAERRTVDNGRSKRRIITRRPSQRSTQQ